MKMLPLVTWGAAGLLWVASSCAVAAPASPRTPAPLSALIEYGDDAPTPAWARDHAREMQSRPFEGVALRCEGGAALFTHQPLKAGAFASDSKALREFQGGKLRANFLIVEMGRERGWSFENASDVRAMEENARLYGQLIRAGHLRGVLFSERPWGVDVPWIKSERDGDLGALQGASRQAGMRFFRALQSEMVPVEMLLVTGKNRGDANDVLPDFLTGALEVARLQDTIIDGDGLSFDYTSGESLLLSYNRRRSRGWKGLPPELRPKFQLVARAASGAYAEWNYHAGGDSPWPADNPTAWLEHNLYYALSTSDDYVWLWSGVYDWWHKAPDPTLTATIERARAKVEQGQPLGFELEPYLRADRDKKRAQFAAKASITRTKGAALRIGGERDPLWQTLPSLGAFRALGSSAPLQPQEQTEVRACYDDTFLYLSFTCHEPDISQVTIAGTKRGDALWEGDTVEFFIDNPARAHSMFQVILNPKGVVFDQMFTTGTGGETASLALQSAGRINRDGWAGELAIRWDSIGGAPTPGQTRYVNIGRGRTRAAQKSSWSPLSGGSFLAPDQMGVWAFAP